MKNIKIILLFIGLFLINNSSFAQFPNQDIPIPEGCGASERPADAIIYVLIMMFTAIVCAFVIISKHRATTRI